MKVPYCIGDLKRDPNLENYPYEKPQHQNTNSTGRAPVDPVHSNFSLEPA